MRFVLVDRILSLEPGRKIVACKAVSLAEEYLADHFPTFPVLPGVLMLEGMVQASAWLVRATLDFQPSVVVLKEARNVTYRSFVSPGETLLIESTCREMTEARSEFSAVGRVGEREILKGRLELAHRSLADSAAELESVDRSIREHMRQLYELVKPGAAATGPVAAGA